MSHVSSAMAQSDGVLTIEHHNDVESQVSELELVLPASGENVRLNLEIDSNIEVIQDVVNLRLDVEQIEQCQPRIFLDRIEQHQTFDQFHKQNVEVPQLHNSRISLDGRTLAVARPV